MYQRLRSHSFVLGTLALLLLGQSVSATAEEVMSTEETLSLRPGSIFEVYAESGPESEINWTLSKGETFVQVSRGALFSMRPTDIAEYFLNGEASEQQGEPVRIVFRIQTSNNTPPVSPAKNDVTQIVVTSPALDAGVVRLEGERRLVRLDIHNLDIEQLAMDINIDDDGNGDGNTFNDNILARSIFAKGRGSLYLWFKPTLTKQTMLIAARLRSGALVTQQIEIVSKLSEEEWQRTTQERLERTTIVEERLNERTYAFSVRTESGAIAAPALYRWNFGDGTQSLIDAPQHQFPKEGTYHVQVKVSDVRTGREILVLEEDVSIEHGTGTDATEEPTNDEPEQTQPDLEERTPAREGSIVTTIVKALVVLAISLGIGLLVVFLISKLKGASLQKSLEEVENKLVGDIPSAAGSVPPLKLAEEEESEKEKDEDEESASKEDTPPPPDQEEPAPAPQETAPQSDEREEMPSWLVASQDAPKESPPPPAQPPAPEPSVVAPPAEPSSNAAVPSWLSGTDGASTPVPPPPRENPLPDPVVKTTPAKTEEASVPAWLKSSEGKELEKPDVKQETTPSPAREPSPAPKQTLPEKPNATLTPEERERERKRRKRQRYRENKRQREQEAGSKNTEAPKKIPSKEAASPSPATQEMPAPQPVRAPAIPEPRPQDAPVPSWLKDASDALPQPAPSQPQEDGSDDDVKFVISADSLGKNTPEPKEDRTPPGDGIPRDGE